MSNVLLNVDNREHHIINKLKLTDLKYSVCSLNIGDFTLQNSENNETMLIIERKTMDDLSSSIIDKRYYEQKERLKQSNAKILYIIENFTKSNSFGITYESLISSMLSMILKDSFFVMRSKNIDETIDILKLIQSKYNSNNFTNDISKSAVITQLSKKSQYSTDNIWISQLCCIPGISFNIAKNIATNYKNYEELYKKYIDEERNTKFLTEIPKIGKILSKTIEKHIFD